MVTKQYTLGIFKGDTASSFNSKVKNLTGCQAFAVQAPPGTEIHLKAENLSSYDKEQIVKVGITGIYQLAFAQADISFTIVSIDTSIYEELTKDGNTGAYIILDVLREER